MTVAPVRRRELLQVEEVIAMTVGDEDQFHLAERGQSLYFAGVLGFVLRKGSMTITLPVVLVRRNVEWPSQSTSTCCAMQVLANMKQRLRTAPTIHGRKSWFPTAEPIPEILRTPRAWTRALAGVSEDPLASRNLAAKFHASRERTHLPRTFAARCVTTALEPHLETRPSMRINPVVLASASTTGKTA
jgi:hypothetical protein